MEYLKIILIRSWEFSNGEGFSENAVRTKARFCVLGFTVATNIFGSADVAGEEVRISGNRHSVLGVLGSKGASGGM